MTNLTEKKPPLFILILLVSFASVSAVLFTPALPQISLKLGISAAQAQLTITVFLIGYALGVLPYGPLSNRYGRKPTIYIGCTLAILGCLLIMLVEKFNFFWLLMVGRLLMALGSSVGLKIAFTMIGDVYQHEKATKTISYLMFSFAVVPSLGVAIGGFLTKTFGWMSCFYFLTGYSLFIFFLSLFLPETCPGKDPHALKIKMIAEGYWHKLKNTKLIVCALLVGCGTSVIYLFAAEAPFIAMNRIGLSPEQYGLLNFIPPVGLIIGSMLANYFAGKKDPLFLISRGIWGVLIISVGMFILFLFGSVNPWTLFIPMPLIYINESLVFANATSLIMTHAKNKSYASAMMSFVNMGLSVFVLISFEAVPAHGTFLMPLVFTATAVIMICLRMSLPRLLIRH